MKSRWDWLYKRQVRFMRFERGVSDVMEKMSKEMGSLRDAMLAEVGGEGRTITFSQVNDPKDFRPK